MSGCTHRGTLRQNASPVTAFLLTPCLTPTALISDGRSLAGSSSKPEVPRRVWLEARTADAQLVWVDVSGDGQQGAVTPATGGGAGAGAGAGGSGYGFKPNGTCCSMPHTHTTKTRLTNRAWLVLCLQSMARMAQQHGGGAPPPTRGSTLQTFEPRRVTSAHTPFPPTLTSQCLPVPLQIRWKTPQ